MHDATLHVIARGVLEYRRHSSVAETLDTRPMTPIVLVHPFFGKRELKQRKRWQEERRGWDPMLMKDLEAHKRYIANIGDVIAASHHPMVTFEEEDVLERTIARYREFGGNSEWYFIPTRAADSTPSTGTWEYATRFLKGLDADTLLMGGGILDGYPGPIDGYRGCLGDTIQHVAQAGLSYRVVPKLTFS